jgi:hypothetical protein
MTNPALEQILLCVVPHLSGDAKPGLDIVFLVKTGERNGQFSGVRNPRDRVVNGFYLMGLGGSWGFRPTGDLIQPSSRDPLFYRLRLPARRLTQQRRAMSLAKIQEGLAKQREAMGWCHDSVTYLFRVAKILGAQVVVINGDHAALDRATFVTMTPDSLRAKIRCWQVESVSNGHGQGAPDEPTH